MISLHQDLVNQTYTHEGYKAFKICDPKPRDIHKACVRDRLVHHAIYRILYPYFDNIFIFDSYSCRLMKGTHRAINRFRDYGLKVSHNNTKTVWILKCDIRKFFANIDHTILIGILKQNIQDKNIIQLLKEVIGSFQTIGRPKVGLPLGNLTSQLLVNIYMNEFDQFMKRKVKTKYYIRYADDFVIFHGDRSYLLALIPQIEKFLEIKLSLSLNMKKLSLKTLASGVDFLGWVHFPHNRQIRTTTKRKIVKNTKWHPTPATINSYRGLLSHGDTYELQKKIGINMY